MILDWRKHGIGVRVGKCRYCGRGAWMRDEKGKPAHKVCAEADIERRAAAAATNTKRKAA